MEQRVAEVRTPTCGARLVRQIRPLLASTGEGPLQLATVQGLRRIPRRTPTVGASCRPSPAGCAPTGCQKHYSLDGSYR
jgi:hypothetical protein